MGSRSALTCLLFSASLLAAQATVAAAPPAEGNSKCRSEDKGGSPAWEAIGLQYSRLARAIQRKDFDAMVALYAPSFDVDMKGELPGNGEVWNREKSLAVQKARLDSVSNTRLISNTITKLRNCGDRAVATVLQEWYRTQNVDGVLRNVETAAVQDEQWIKFPDGWKRGSIGNIHQGAALVDNKRIDGSKPYRPNDPPFVPFSATAVPPPVPPARGTECRLVEDSSSPLWRTLGIGHLTFSADFMAVPMRPIPAQPAAAPRPRNAPGGHPRIPA